MDGNTESDAELTIDKKFVMVLTTCEKTLANQYIETILGIKLAKTDLNVQNNPTDCDGVLLQWEKAFYEWMELNGFEQIGKGHYDIDMMYHLPQGFSKTLIKIFK